MKLLFFSVLCAHFFLSLIFSSQGYSADREPSSVPQPKPEKTNDDQSKEKYNFFNPTPEDKMRDFNPDRPGSTNTPYSVDAGHTQVELEFFNYSEQKVTDGKTSQLNYFTPTIRVGITNSSEVGVSYTTYLTQKVRNTDGSEENLSGGGDVNLSYKKNILGNEGGPVAWGYQLVLKVPSDNSKIGNQSWEPSLLIPISFDLGSWSVSIMPEIDFRKNESDNSLHSEFNSPFTFGHKLYGPIDFYAEFVTHTNNEIPGSSSSYFGIGFTFKLLKESQLDLGCNFGTNSATPQTNPFAGWTTRF